MGHSCGCGHDHGQEEKEAPMPADSENGGPNAERIGQKPQDCACGHDHSAGGHKISHEDMEKLMKEIEKAGYKASVAPDGDIKISE